MPHFVRMALMGAALGVGLQLASAPAMAEQDPETGTIGGVGKVIILGGASERADGGDPPRVNRHYIQPKVPQPREKPPSSSAPEDREHYSQPRGQRYNKRNDYQRGKRYHRSKRYYHYTSRPYRSHRSDRYPRYNYGSYPYPSQMRNSYRQRSSYGLYFRLRH